MKVDPHVRTQFESHLQRFFSGHPRDVASVSQGPIENRIQGFHVDVFQPGPRQSACWTYVTCGAASLEMGSGHRLEFFLFGLRPHARWVEFATMTAYYHAGPDHQRLGVGHTVPLGEPIVAGSQCDHVLYSLPYVFGPELENCDLDDGSHIQVLWELPITTAEKNFKAQHGLEELESRFERAGLEYWDMSRKSVV